MPEPAEHEDTPTPTDEAAELPPLDDLTNGRAQEEEAALTDEDEPVDFEGEPWDRPWKGAFLTALTRLPNVTTAARAAGVTRQGAHYAKKSDPRFARAWKQAIQEGVDTLERFAMLMGTTGLEQVETRTTRKRALRDVVGEDGKTTATLVVIEENEIEVRSRMVAPNVAMFLLSAHRSSVYRRPQRFEHTGADGDPIKTADVSKEAGDVAVGVLSARVASIADARRARERAAGSGES